MQGILFEYSLNPTTWAYLSALLTLGIYFKFHRFWSVRNLDLVGLIVFSPGILLVYHGLIRENPGLVQFGYSWLFGVGAFFVVRLFLDPIMVRRPLLEPNLNASGLTFTGAALLVFLIANVLTSRVSSPVQPDSSTTLSTSFPTTTSTATKTEPKRDRPLDRLEHALARRNATAWSSPGFAPFFFVASFSEARTRAAEKLPPRQHPLWSYPSLATQTTVSQAIAIVALVVLVLGIVTIGFRHFGNAYTGVAAASLYLLLPYAGQMTGRIDHLVPAALLVWTVAAYRRPLVAGILMGLVATLIFYPLFLLPLWCSFYLRRGLLRFAYGFVASLALMVGVLALLSTSGPEFWIQFKQMFGTTMVWQEGAMGFWNALPDRPIHSAYRFPVIALFAVMSVSLGLWPAQKNLGTILSCSATVMLGTQFIHAHEGGLYMAWYLPLLVLTIFRPNLEDRVALSAVIEGGSTWPVRLVAWWRHRFARSGEPV